VAAHGRDAIASYPRCPGATTKISTETLDLGPPVVCILAVNRDPARDRGSRPARTNDSVLL
jgi:hypothetical protein